ncbi:MAG: hypothetical protein AAF813_08005 [Pseudomonadota bacterium]
MTQILSLDRTDRVALDTTALLRLEVALGATRSREVLTQACCEIIEKLTHVECCVANGDFEKAARYARGIASLSGEIGLVEFSQAARGAADSLKSGDPVAIAATTDRMTRLGEVSLDTLLHPVTTEDH